MEEGLREEIFKVERQGFEALAMEVFHWQYQYNDVYRAYVNAIGRRPSRITNLNQIPFLPIRFFKSHNVQTGSFIASQVFESSGTTGMIPSRHSVKDLAVYEQSFKAAFRDFYGDPSTWCIIGLLPSYLERKGSSLIYMVDTLIKDSGHPDSGFYLNEFEKLATLLKKTEAAGQQVLFIGVTFALLDFAELFPMPLKHTIVMETGGMKGRREELIRAAVHDKLKTAFDLDNVHSEYGMTELLSQAYAPADGLFTSPPWMQVLLRDEEDPFNVFSAGMLDTPKAGVINIIDLANIYSSAFIATDDAGRLYPDGRFEVLGRVDNSDVRGCSLLVI